MVPSKVKTMIVGIDFGTCFSSAAIMNGLIPVTNYASDTAEGIPSLFMYSKELGKELYGSECEGKEGLRNEGDVVRYMKRQVRENPDSLSNTIMSGGKEYLLKDIIEKYLTYLVSEVRRGARDSGEFKSDEIDAVTVTAPVGIAQGQMMASDYNKLLQDMMCRITDLDASRVFIVQEPVAAAISYLYSADIRKHYDASQSILVFDLGGGTLDVTILEHDPQKMTYEIKAKEGDLMLGGNDWDDRLADLVMKKVGIEGFSSELDESRFRRDITRMKQDLSLSEKAGIMFEDSGEDYVAKITREEFEDCTKELLDRAIAVVKKAMESYGGMLDRIVLVGGSSNMPQILGRIRSEFSDGDDDFVQVYEPSKAIAKGAAVFAKLNSSSDGPSMGTTIIDIATHTYGFDSRKDGQIDMIYNMIFKGTPFKDSDRISVRSETSFIPQRNDQTRVSFRIYESEASKGVGEDGNWMPYGNGEMYNGLEVSVQVPPEYLGKAKGFNMWPELSLDSNGILEITVRDRSGNRLAYGTTAGGFDDE